MSDCFFDPESVEFDAPELGIPIEAKGGRIARVLGTISDWWRKARIIDADYNYASPISSYFSSGGRLAALAELQATPYKLEGGTAGTSLVEESTQAAN